MKKNMARGGQILLTDSSMVKVIEQKRHKTVSQRSLEQDILKAVTVANELGAHGIRVKGIKLDPEQGLQVEPGDLYSDADLAVYRAKLKAEIANHKTTLWDEGVLEKNMRPEGEFTAEDFLKMVDEYEKAPSKNP